MKSSRANEPKANAMNEKHSRNPRKLLAKLGRNAVTFLLTASMVIWQTPAAAFAAPNGDDGSPQPASPASTIATSAFLSMRKFWPSTLFGWNSCSMHHAFT